MATKEEPSYMMFARANVRDNLSSTPAVVKALLERIDSQQAVLEATVKTFGNALDKMADVPPMPSHWQGRYRAP